MVSEDACAGVRAGGSVSLFPNLLGCPFLGLHSPLSSYPPWDGEGGNGDRKGDDVKGEEGSVVYGGAGESCGIGGDGGTAKAPRGIRGRMWGAEGAQEQKMRVM